MRRDSDSYGAILDDLISYRYGHTFRAQRAHCIMGGVTMISRQDATGSPREIMLIAARTAASAEQGAQ